jgi:hypothetical protein
MAERLLATLLVLVLVLSAPAVSTAQPELQRVWHEREAPLVPRLPRLSNGSRPTLDSPFPVPAPRSDPFLSPQDVRIILAARHLTLIGELRRRGDYYVMEARGPRGEVVRLVVNGYSGVVEGVRVLGPKPGDKPGDRLGRGDGGPLGSPARDDAQPGPPPR